MFKHFSVGVTYESDDGNVGKVSKFDMMTLREINFELFFQVYENYISGRPVSSQLVKNDFSH